MNIKSKSQVFSFLKNKNNLDIYFLATHNISSTQRENDDLFLNESADLLFHFLVLLQYKGYELNDVVNILKKRNK